MLIRAVRLAVFLLLLSLGGHAVADAGSSLVKAGDAYLVKDYQDAEKILAAIDKKSLSNIEKVLYYKLLGLIKLALGDEGAAEMAFVNILRIEPSYELSGQQYQISVSAAFHIAKSNYSNTIYKQGIRDYDAGRFLAAQDSFKKTIMMNPAHPMAEDLLKLSIEKSGTKLELEKEKEKVDLVSKIAPGYSKLAVLGKQDAVYLDRDYVVSSLADAHQGLTLIRTVNDDKKDESFKLTFDLSEAATVYVAHDTRVNKIPLWLNVFTKTSNQIVLDRGGKKSTRTFDVYRKEFEAGGVLLGANLAARFGAGKVSMYFVFVAPKT